MEYKRIWLKYSTEANTEYSSGMISASCYPSDNEDTAVADKEIKSYLNNGWRIVSTCPVTASKNFLTAKGDDVYLTFTSGIEVFMVRD